MARLSDVDRRAARAMLELLRLDPGEVVLRAGGQEYAMTHQRVQTAESQAYDIWRAMIDAALKEGDPND